MKPDIAIENYFFSRKLPRWATLPDAEKLQLLETARCRTYRTGGTGRQVATIVLVVAVLAIPLLLLPALLVDDLFLRSTGIFFMVIAVLLAANIHRCYQLLPELERLLNDPPPDAP